MWKGIYNLEFDWFVFLLTKLDRNSLSLKPKVASINNAYFSEMAHVKQLKFDTCSVV